MLHIGPSWEERPQRGPRRDGRAGELPTKGQWLQKFPWPWWEGAVGLGTPAATWVGVEGQCLLPALISCHSEMLCSADEGWQIKHGQLSISHFVSFILLTHHSPIAKRKMLESQQSHKITATGFAKSKDMFILMAQSKAVGIVSITLLAMMTNPWV